MGEGTRSYVQNASPEARLWAKVDCNGQVPEHRPDLGPCWVFTGALTGRGYGSLYVGKIDGKRRIVAPHILAFELSIGPVPEGLELDHLCRNRACCNPSHLEPVTRRENVLRGEGVAAKQARQTHCKNGHPLSGRNLVPNSRGARQCRECKNESERRARRRAS